MTASVSHPARREQAPDADIAALVALAPPLSPERFAELRALLAPGAQVARELAVRGERVTAAGQIARAS